MILLSRPLQRRSN